MSYLFDFKVLILFTAVLFTGAAFPADAQAQNAQALEIQGLSINPFIIELEMRAGQSEQRSISLTNTTDAPLTFTASINDFVVNGNSGQPIFRESLYCQVI